MRETHKKQKMREKQKRIRYFLREKIEKREMRKKE